MKLTIIEIAVQDFYDFIELLTINSHVKIVKSQTTKALNEFLEEDKFSFYSIGKLFQLIEYKDYSNRRQLYPIYKLVKGNWSKIRDSILNEHIDSGNSFRKKRALERKQRLEKDLNEFKLFEKYCKKYYKDSNNQKSYFACS